jgi:hypothetical protein
MFVLEEVMEFRFILQSVLELGIVAFIIYGLFFEERFVAVERRIFAFIKKKLKGTKPAAKRTSVISADRAS